MGEVMSGSDDAGLVQGIPDGVEDSDPRAVLCSKASDWGFEYEWQEMQLPDNRVDRSMSLIFKSGRTNVKVFTPIRRAERILRLEPIRVIAVPKYDAFIFDGKTLEVAVSNVNNTFGPTFRRFWSAGRFPWVRFEEDNSSDPEDDDDFPSSSWAIEVSGGPNGSVAKIGSASKRYRAFGGMMARETLTIEGFQFGTTDESVSKLEMFRDDLAFDFDLKYGMPFALRRRPARSSYRRRGVRIANPSEPSWPRNSYPSDPVSLYWYARSASGLPLLEFLAYYQVLEYFFPHHFMRERMTRVREQLKDPRFRFDNDADLTRLIQTASSGSTIRGAEEDQLRATVHGSVAKDVVLQLISDDDRLLDALTGKKKLNAVPQLNLQDRTNDIRDQLARRIYAIRCRIVHSKIDGGARDAPPLLPFSAEAEDLGPDIEVLQFLAQKAIIAGSAPRLT
jgi:hypothetical protein